MREYSTNYYNTLITVAEDTKAVKGTTPPHDPVKPTIGSMQFDMITSAPLNYTSDEILFNIHAQRSGIESSEYETKRKLFFAKGQPCLRTSVLAKSYGWGIYADQSGKIKLIDMAAEEYNRLLDDINVSKISAMRSKRTKI